MNSVETRELLARNQTSQIEVCNKGVVHVQSGAVTMHLTFEQAKDLATSLDSAMLKLLSLTSDIEFSGLRLAHSLGANNE